MNFMDYGFYREFEALKNLVLILEDEVKKLKGVSSDAEVAAIKN